MAASLARAAPSLARASLHRRRSVSLSVAATMGAAQSRLASGKATPKPATRVAASAPAAAPDAYEAFAASQASAPRPGIPEEAKTLVQCASLGVLSTLTPSGHPVGSMVQYAVDEAGRLVMSLSTMSAHTRELAADPRCSLCVLSPWGFTSMADARVTVTGAVAAPVPPEETAAAKAVYMAAHPDAYWTEFGDFGWWRIDPAAPGAAARAVLGFGRAGTIEGAAWREVAVDPVSAFSAPVCGHMNADHGDAVAAMVAAAGVPGKIVRAAMKKVDSLGFDAVAAVESGGGGGGRSPPETFSVRVPYPGGRVVEGRKELKDVLVEMTKAAKQAGGGV